MFDEEKLRKEICEIMERLYIRNLISSVGGNVSVIAREENFILITPTKLDKKGLEPEDIVKINTYGEVLSGGKPSSETVNHLEIYKERKDINAIVHAHPPFSVGIISAGCIPRAITPEHAILSGDLAVIDFVTPGEKSSRFIAKTLKKSNIVMIKNHGPFSVGKSLMESFSRIEILEEASKMLIAGKLFGGMPEFSLKEIKNVFGKYGKKS